MDKIAANNHFVTLRKEVKKAKAMVSGNLIRNIGKLKLKKEKLDDETQHKKIDAKIASTHEEVRLLKTIDPYIVSKNATLKPDPKLWSKIICDSKATTEERLIARLIIKNNIQRAVQKFKTDHKECDEWINEYIEYREKKREIEDASKKSKKKRKSDKTLTKQKKKNNQENSSKPQNRNAAGSETVKAPKGEREGVTPLPDIDESEKSLHPSWLIKKKEKELLKAAFSGKISKPHRITFDK